MPASLTQVFLKLSIHRDHLLCNKLVLVVRVANFGLQIIITGLLVLVKAIDVFEEPLIKDLCLILGSLETLLQIFERVDLNDIEVLRICIPLSSLNPLHQVRIAGDLLVILVEGNDLLRDALHDLLLKIGVDISWKTIETMSNEFVVYGIRLHLTLNASDNSC